MSSLWPCNEWTTVGLSSSIQKKKAKSHSSHKICIIILLLTINLVIVDWRNLRRPRGSAFTDKNTLRSSIRFHPIHPLRRHHHPSYSCFHLLPPVSLLSGSFYPHLPPLSLSSREERGVDRRRRWFHGLGQPFAGFRRCSDGHGGRDVLQARLLLLLCALA